MYIFISISPEASFGPVRQKKSKKRLAELKSFSLEEPLHADLGERGVLTRSKTYDPPSLLRSENGPSLERRRSITSNLPKHNLTFHKIFQDIPEDEELKDSFSCALQKEVLYQGRLYISSNYLGFYSSMLRKGIKILIPVNTVIVLKKAHTALLVPNALSVKTVEGDKYLFGSLRNRELCYQAVRAVCTNLQNSSHSDIDQNLQESDSADIYSTCTDVKLDRQRWKSGSSEVNAVTLSHWNNAGMCQEKVPVDNTNRAQWAEPRTVNILLIIYMLLVVLLLVSSGYIGLRITELENQLNVMGAWPKGDDFNGLYDS
ncbi:hypothetical protein GDO86_000920 [Hymenochirus boettgeri]|uniref:GRAM domain-containing protein n=1 Tax=Hymenochirus boettgeri TaxID=247094 RepID=A0A8T2KFZ0_9PIPI|nr:hypothetical protein GDO86_000920 [Hymenochirus boettgeri]